MASSATAAAVQLVIGEDRSHKKLVAELAAGGELAPGVKITPVSLEFTDPDTPMELWLSIGRLNGMASRSINWWIGDWILWGEELYGEEASQGVDSIQERYNEAERITGIDHQTLLNIASLCRRVPKARRRAELGYWIHAEVAAMEPDDQKRWLQAAIDGSWNRAELRAAIREERNPATDPPLEPPPNDYGGLTPAERLATAARLVFHQAQRTSDGSVIVPAEPWAQLAAALGEE